jgi:hypothetical protein
MSIPTALRTTIIVVATVLVLAACGTAGSTGSAPSDPGTIDPETPIGSGVEPGEPGLGGGGNPGAGAEPTVPQPGQLDVHPVPAESLEAAVDGRRVTVRISWTSGVEPCNVLDSIGVDRSGTAFAITLREGHGPGDNICIEIAKFKFTLLDLGELEPGTYSITDWTGGAAPIEVVVG